MAALVLTLALLAAGLWRPRLGWGIAGGALAGWLALRWALLNAPAWPGLRLLAGWTVAAAIAAVTLGAIAALRWLRARAVPLPVRGPAPAAPEVDDALTRYARHIVLREIGGPGQARLRDARVLVVGAGGLGAPVCLYLAAAGVGRLTVADDDTVGLSNLQRQVIFRTADAGRPKAEAAADAMLALNPHSAVTPLLRRVGEGDVALVRAHDLVVDGTDSFAARAAVNRACVAAGVPMLGGAIAQWEGQVALWHPAAGGPCLACVFPRPPAPGLAPSCAEVGVAGPLPGLVGGMLALEAVKHLTGAGETLLGRIWLHDGLAAESRTLRIHRDPTCPVCAGAPRA